MEKQEEFELSHLSVDVVSILSVSVFSLSFVSSCGRKKQMCMDNMGVHLSLEQSVDL